MLFSNADFFAWVEEELASGNSVSMIVKGFSMMPLIRNNRDSVCIEPCRVQDLQKGDIALFRHGGAHVLHRLVGKKGEMFIMRGDNVFTHCEACKADDIIGRVAYVKRGDKKISPHSIAWKSRIVLWRIKGRLIRLARLAIHR